MLVGFLPAERAVHTARGGVGTYAVEIHRVQREDWAEFANRARQPKPVWKPSGQLPHRRRRDSPLQKNMLALQQQGNAKNQPSIAT